jgi:hypothetical protein
MAYVIYTARRSLAPGHVAEISYTLPLILTRADRRRLCRRTYKGRDELHRKSTHSRP